MSKSGVRKVSIPDPQELLDKIVKSYQTLLVCDITNLKITLNDMITSLSSIKSTSDSVVNKAGESLNWKCQAWRDKLFMLEKGIEVEIQYSAAWSKPISEKQQQRIAKMQRDFNVRFKSDIQSAYADCPSYTSFELSTLKGPAPTNQFIFANQQQPIIFSLKPKNALTESDKGLWGSLRTGASSSELQASGSPRKEKEGSITVFGF